MRRFIAGSLLVMVALTLGACGGGGGEEAATTEAPATSEAAPAVPGAPTGPKVDTRSPTETVTNEPFPRNEKTPADVTTRLGNGQPMILFFYDTSQPETGEQRASLDAVIEKYRGLIDLLSYDINAGGKDSETAKSEDVKKAADMASQLKVSYTPYIVFVDRYGRVTYRFSGVTDQQMLEREALRATQ